MRQAVFQGEPGTLDAGIRRCIYETMSEEDPGGAGARPSRKTPSPAAQRALAEANARRMARATMPPSEPELRGRGGLDPARYGDWEVKGLASDF